MNLGIIVEGPYDPEAYRRLIRRIRNDIETIPAIPCGGLPKLKAKFVGFLKFFEWRTFPAVDKALVIRDSDCGDVQALERELAEILTSSGYNPRFPVHFYATKCELETWLLADEAAIVRTAQARGKAPDPLIPVGGNLETQAEPYDLLLKNLSRVKLSPTPQLYAEIADNADLDRIASRCPYFREFQARVKAC